MTDEQWQEFWQGVIDEPQPCRRCGEPMVLTDRRWQKVAGISYTVSRWTCFQCKAKNDQCTK